MTNYDTDGEAKLNFLNWYLRVVLVGEIDSTLDVFGGEAWVRTEYVNRYWSAENSFIIREVALRHGCDWCLVLMQLVSLRFFIP